MWLSDRSAAWAGWEAAAGWEVGAGCAAAAGDETGVALGAVAGDWGAAIGPSPAKQVAADQAKAIPASIAARIRPSEFPCRRVFTSASNCGPGRASIYYIGTSGRRPHPLTRFHITLDAPKASEFSKFHPSAFAERALQPVLRQANPAFHRNLFCRNLLSWQLLPVAAENAGKVRKL
jgi:hypothetical protein